jgi:hypothetical protein
MDWAVLEILKIVILAVLAVGIHRTIRRFGESYAAEVFQTTPHIGRSFVILADFAYYLIFAGYVLFNVHFERPPRFDARGNPVGYQWDQTVGAAQLQESVFSIAGICLIIGILHGVNVFVLPFVGSVLALRARLLEDGRRPEGQTASGA